MKKCNTCKVNKPLQEFGKRTFKKRFGPNVVKILGKCKKCLAVERKRYYNRDVRTGLLNNVRQRTKTKGYAFDLTLDDIVIPDVCPILGVPLKRGTQANYRYSPSIDRIDSNKGYTKDNIKVISMLANRMKSDATKEECIAFAKNIIDYYNDDIV
jgi:hypothetical protein